MGFVAKALAPAEEKASVAEFDTVRHDEWLRRNGYLDDGAAAYDSYTRRSATPSNALEVTGVLACVKIIGEDTASTPFPVFRRASDGSVEPARDDWRWSLLHEMANPDMCSEEVVEAITASAALTGDGLAAIDRWDQGRRAWLWPLDAGDVTIVRDDRQRRIFYEIRGERRKTGSEVFHLRGFTFNGAMGDKILSRVRRALGIALSAQEFAGRHFANGVHADLFFEHPAGGGSKGPEIAENIHKGFQKHNQGVSKAGLPFILQEGMRARRMPPDLRRQQVLEARKFQILEICRGYRIQPHLLAELDRATFNNVEELQRYHQIYTLGPWRRRWSGAVRRHLLTPDEQTNRTIYAEHNVEALLRGDFTQQMDAFSKGLLNGVYSINEVRRWLNMNPIPGGDAHRVQMQMGDVAEAAAAAVESGE